MDLTSNPELQALFREEVGERAVTLATGSASMETSRLDPNVVTDLRRDAHTIKGNALVMGFPHMAAAAKLIEDYFRDIENDVLVQDPVCGRMIADIAEAFPDAIDQELEGEPESLNACVATMRSYLDGTPREPDPGGGPGQPSDAEASAEVGDGIDESVTEENPSSPEDSQLAPPADVVELLREDKHSVQDLGGLISSIGSNLEGESTRVDTARLYQLINRVVEVRLDSAALREGLEELTMDATEGVSVAQMLERWARELGLLVRSIESSVGSLQTEALDLASVPLSEATNSFDQLVRFLVRRTGKEVRFEQKGETIEIDRQVVEALREPLRHLIVNAVDHGVEDPATRKAAGKNAAASVKVTAQLHDSLLRVTVSDDGKGIDWSAISDRGDGAMSDELVHRLFQPSVTSIESPGEISGDGLGLAVVDEAVRALGGTVHLESGPDGTEITLSVPASLSLQKILIVETGSQQWGIPEAAVAGVVPVSGDLTDDFVLFESDQVPAFSFSNAVGIDLESSCTRVVILETPTGRIALGVDSEIERREVAVKQLGPMLAGSPHLAGAAILGGDNVVVVVSPDALARRVMSLPALIPVNRPRVLVVDDSLGVRQLLGASLTSSGFEVETAGSAMGAREELARSVFDALVVDYSMPGHDGIELVSVVRAEAPALPIVMVSGVAEPADQSRAYAAGVDAYLSKSDFREGVLASTLWSLIEGEMVATL